MWCARETGSGGTVVTVTEEAGWQRGPRTNLALCHLLHHYPFSSEVRERCRGALKVVGREGGHAVSPVLPARLSSPIQQHRHAASWQASSQFMYAVTMHCSRTQAWYECPYCRALLSCFFASRAQPGRATRLRLSLSGTGGYFHG